MARARFRPLLAKLAPPRVPGALRRERLFALVAGRRERPVVWVSGPPGAGKTTLVAGYLAESNRAGVWYQVDRGDSDPASFFYYLARAVPSRRAGQTPLPALTPEYLPDLEGFSRRFFREAFARLPPHGAVVLDNYQEVATDSAFHAVVAIAVDELPPGMNLLIVSRAAPPPQFARHAAGARIAELGWDELRLTPTETAAIARSNGVNDATAAGLLHVQCAGWAGGLRLLLEELRRSGAVPGPGRAQTLDAVFDYFAEQVFAAMPPRLQRFLLRTHVLPRMTAALAQEVSGERTAERMLEDLYRRHLFTDRRIGDQVSYQYHALFRAFLSARAADMLDDDGRLALHARAAELLERAGMLEEAVESSQAARQLDTVARLVCEHAASLLAQGRGLTLRRWIEGLPPERRQRDPALSYWLGTSLIAVDQERARLALEQAYRLYAAQSDLTGQLLSTSGIIETRFLRHADHRLIDPWLPVHEAILRQARADTPAEAQLRAFATMLIALLYRQPGHPMLEAYAQRVLVLVESVEIAPDPRIVAATFLMWYCGYTGDHRIVRRLSPIGAALAARDEVTALHRANWWTWLGYSQHCMLDNEAAQSTLERALAIGQADNLPGVIFLASYFAGLVAVRLDRQDTAIQCLRRMEAMADPASRIQRAILHAYRGWLAVEREQPAEALREGEVAWDLGAELGSPSYLVHWGTPMVYGLVEAGRYGEARERLTLQREAMGGTRIRCFDPMLIAIEATLALREGDVDVARTLAVRAFRVAREQDHGGYLRRIKPWLGALAWLALEADAEVDYVQRFIGQARLEPPSQTARRWPWRCRVSALGRFEVLVDGRPLEHGRKVPKKPLALLRALIAAAKAAASDDALCEALWPDLDGDAAHQALTSAIHRLRVLLGSPGAVLVAGQRVCLNAREVWVDAWAFESLADAAGARDAMRAADALALYGGAFLPQEADSAWVLSMRERLRAKFIRLAAQLADAEEAAGRLEDAAAHYRRGLEVDDLAEPFCLGLMRCCKALDRPGEGIVAYRNLRQLLSVTLGRQPARDTEALYRDLLARG